MYVCEILTARIKIGKNHRRTPIPNFIALYISFIFKGSRRLTRRSRIRDFLPIRRSLFAQKAYSYCDSTIF